MGRESEGPCAVDVYVLLFFKVQRKLSRGVQISYL